MSNSQKRIHQPFISDADTSVRWMAPRAAYMHPTTLRYNPSALRCGGRLSLVGSDQVNQIDNEVFDLLCKTTKQLMVSHEGLNTQRKRQALYKATKALTHTYINKYINYSYTYMYYYCY